MAENYNTMGRTNKSPGDWTSLGLCKLFGTPNFVNQGCNCGVGNIVTNTSVYGYDTMSVIIYPGKTQLTIIWGSKPAKSPELP